MNKDGLPYFFKGDIGRLARDISSDLCVILPGAIFRDPHFIDVPAESKLLYGHMLSEYLTKKGITDVTNRYYLKMPLKSIEALFGCCHTSASKYLSALADYGYVDKVSLGKGRGTNIYVKNLIPEPVPVLSSYSDLRVMHSRTG